MALRRVGVVSPQSGEENGLSDGTTALGDRG
ncbi:MAG: hypothetical protein JWP48_4035 [Actinoallomurus sp.]|nr:hypothetical protein [Actinoallomurus sp.]